MTNANCFRSANGPDQCDAPELCVLLEEQLEPLGATEVVACFTPGHDVDEGFQVRPTMDVVEILRHIVGAL